MYEQKINEAGGSGQKGRCCSVAKERLIAGITELAVTSLVDIAEHPDAYDAYEQGMTLGFASMEEINAFLLGLNEAIEQKIAYNIPDRQMKFDFPAEVIHAFPSTKTTA